MIRRPPRSTHCISSAASDVYKRQSLFQRFGHVYRYPMFEEEKGYKWKVAVRLDNSFRFLISKREDAARLFESDRVQFFNWLAGLIDSDGHIRTSNGSGYARVTIAIYSTRVEFLKSIIQATLDFGYRFDGPYRGAKEGSITSTGIRYNADFWNITLQRTSEAQELLKELPVRHEERIARKELALTVRPGTRWSEVESRIHALRTSIRTRVAAFVLAAEDTYNQTHQREMSLGRSRKK